MLARSASVEVLRSPGVTLLRRGLVSLRLPVAPADERSQILAGQKMNCPNVLSEVGAIRTDDKRTHFFRVRPLADRCFLRSLTKPFGC
jgi:hypothetical protein